MNKKEYDAKEVAQAILKKAEQTIKNNKSFQKSLDVKEAVSQIKGSKKLNEVLPKVASDKKDDVLRQLRMDKADPQNMNAAQSQGLKGIKLPSAPKAKEKPEMKTIAPPAPQTAAKMPRPLKSFMGKREMKKSDKSVADKAVAGAKTPDHDAKAFDLPKKTVADLIKEKEAAKKAKV